MVGEEDNEMLEVIPNDVEIKKVILSLNGDSDSDSGPYGLSGRFY